MTIVALTPEWYAARRLGIGASEVACLFGADPYRTETELYAVKVGRVPDVETEEMRMGRLLEPFLLDLFRASLPGVIVWPDQTMRADNDSPHLFATPDGGYLRGVPDDHVDEKGPARGRIETKATSEPERSDGAAPLRWVLQGMAQMACSNERHTKVAVLYQSTRFRIHDVPRNDAVIAAIRERVESWWWRYVRKGEIPREPGKPIPMELLRQIYPEEVPGKTVVLPPEAERWDDEIARLDAEIKKAKRHRDEYKSWIAEAIGDAESGTIPGRRGRWRWKVQEREEHVVKEGASRQLRRLVK